MKKLKAAWIFYRRLILPSVALSIAIGLVSPSSINSYKNAFAFAWMFAPGLFQLLLYDLVKNPSYYFFENLGLSKSFLRIFTLGMSISSGIILLIV